MMKKLNLDAKAPEKSIKVIEKVLNRMIPRLHKSVGVLVPPSTFSYLSTGWDSNKVVHTHMFPVKGTLRQLLFFIETTPEDFNGMELEIQLIKPDNSVTTQTVKCGRSVVTADINVGITPGMRLKTICKTPDVTVHNIWCCGSYDIIPSSMSLQEELINNLEEIDERIKTDTDAE